ncbi:hypothetical protein DL96DRAFT_1818476 [Flagelloscypha sp. PMI_526]|nr:hypothetical protein DL96DRAFT_1818476 [Flagelloscypha sp. PMI_526]
MTQTPMNSTPRLPAELEEYIFILAASTCDQDALARFRSVSRVVKEWIEPFRFRCLMFTSNSRKYYSPLVSQQPGSSLLMVRHIWLATNNTEDRNILSRCTSITTLSHCLMHPKSLWHLSDFSSLRYLNLTEATARALFSIQRLGMLPPSLTHFRVHAPFSSTAWIVSMKNSLPSMPSVTHLMISYYPHGYPWHVWQALRFIVLDDLNNIQRLVLLQHPFDFPDDEEWAGGSLEPLDEGVGTSHKVVWLEVDGDWTLKEDWKRRCRGDIDAWDQAEIIVQERGS